MRIHLSKRLNEIAKLVHGKTIADVGCDGANLAIWLVQNRGFLVYATDLRAGPLKKAEFNIKKFGVLDGVRLIQADGLRGVPAVVDEVVIAGLGGEQIEKILLSCSWIKNHKIRLILQPQSFSAHLKQSLFSSGFFIEHETYIIDKNKVYLIFVARFCGLKKSLSLNEVLVGGLKKNDLGSLAWVKFQKRRLLRVLDGLNFAEQTDEVLNKKLRIRRLYSVFRDWEVI